VSEANVIKQTQMPLTIESMVEQFTALGLAAGQTMLVHSAMSKLGWVVGGPEAVIRALLQVLTPSGTLMMPTHTTYNTDPAMWNNPPVPESWVQIIREHTPAYNPATTPSREMGAIAELFRNWPGVLRSNHPVASFAARGPNAEYLLADHKVEYDVGDGSPVGKLYEFDGHVLLVGVGHGNNTSLHLAEFRSDWPDKPWITTGSAMLVEGKRQWVSYRALDIDDSDFEQLGADYEAKHPVTKGKVGNAEVRFFRQRPIVDFAVEWIALHRG
jgi:aminoglycoside 3-N-acetyltransferase